MSNPTIADVEVVLWLSWCCDNIKIRLSVGDGGGQNDDLIICPASYDCVVALVLCRPC